MMIAGAKLNFAALNFSHSITIINAQYRSLYIIASLIKYKAPKKAIDKRLTIYTGEDDHAPNDQLTPARVF